ncbi:MAG: hypothetical protein JF616_10265 [Fibrobacteres bacterium]|nr:hypothetical protein [Fibrobacterota bacterium]
MGLSGRVLFVAALAVENAMGAPSLLAPEAFRSMANSSISVLRTQREYLRDFDEGQADATGHWFFYFDLRYALPETEGARMRIPTTVGEMQGELSRGALGFRVAYLQGEYAFGLYDIAESFSLSPPRAWNPAFLRYYGKDSSGAADEIAWSQEYQNFAITLERADHFRIAAGLFDRSFPLFSGAGENAQFALVPGPDSASAWQGSRDHLQAFLDIDVHGYGFSTLYTLGQSLDLIGLRKRWRWGEAELIPALNYFRYRRRSQIGAEAKGILPYPALELGSEAYADSRRASDGERGFFGHASASISYRLWPWNLPAGRSRFQVAANTSGGWSDDALEKGVWGHSEGLACDNLLKVLHFSLAHSRNDPRVLQQMPLRGADVWSFDFKFAW